MFFNLLFIFGLQLSDCTEKKASYVCNYLFTFSKQLNKWDNHGKSELLKKVKIINTVLII